MGEAKWLWTDEELAESAERPNLLVEILKLIESGEMTDEQSAALDEYLSRNQCPECGR